MIQTAFEITVIGDNYPISGAVYYPNSVLVTELYNYTTAYC